MESFKQLKGSKSVLQSRVIKKRNIHNVEPVEPSPFPLASFFSFKEQVLSLGFSQDRLRPW